jgi:hypothetical protein
MTVLAVLLSVGLAGYAGWSYVQQRSSHFCNACQRPVHATSRTIAVSSGGSNATYCCPACALSEHQQTAKPLQLVELTDYLTGRPLPPAQAFLVRNSDVNSCRHDEAAPITANKRPLHVHYDRCSPSILSFTDRAAATRFAAQHGGQVLPSSELAAQLSTVAER